MNRIAYYGTFGAPGHQFRAIRGRFSTEEVKNISKIDSDVYIKSTAAEGFRYFWYANFLGYAIPFSLDDSRPGCISVIFVEYATLPDDILETIEAYPELRRIFARRLPRLSDIDR